MKIHPVIDNSSTVEHNDYIFNNNIPFISNTRRFKYFDLNVSGDDTYYYGIKLHIKYKK